MDMINTPRVMWRGDRKTGHTVACTEISDEKKKILKVTINVPFADANVFAKTFENVLK